MVQRSLIAYFFLLLLLFAGRDAPAAEAPVRRNDPKAGSAFEMTIDSEALGEQRGLTVRLPRDYNSSEKRYPVFVVLDAEWHFNIAAADVELLSECSYLGTHPIPEMIVVGVVNLDRNRDFTPTHNPRQGRMSFPTSGGAAAFRRFLVDEALPLIDRSFRTSPYRVLAGWSLGGLFTIDTLLSRPSAFDGYLAISPSLWWDDGVVLERLTDREAIESPTREKRLVITLGGEEKETSVARSTNEFVSRTNTKPLEKMNSELVPVEGLGHNLSPKMAYFLGLAHLFSDWVPPASVLDESLDAVDAYYQSLSTRYRIPVPIPESVYGNLGWKLFEAGRLDDARSVFDKWVERHPSSSVALASLGSFCRESGDSDRAVALLERAVAMEAARPDPRETFIHDLRRDIEVLRSQQ